MTVTKTPTSTSLWPGWPGWLLPLVLGLVVAGLAGGLLVGRFMRPRVPPIPPSVQVVPHAGPPAQLSVHPTGTDAAHTVRIEPHPSDTTTTTEEQGP